MPRMTPRLWALSLAPVLAAASAHAQAPGEIAPYAPDPSAQPAPAPAPAPGMAHRWSIGVSIGGLGVLPAGAPEGSEARFRVGELALRYRASRRLELELAASGGREVLDDDTEGELATGTVTVALRYRLRPEHRWNGFLMAGLGGTVIAPHDSTAAEREGATRPLGMLGVGVERRFRRLALQAELRMVGYGQREDAGGDVIVDDGPVPPPTMPVPRLPGAAAPTHAEELRGGMLTLGASFYF